MHANSCAWFRAASSARRRSVMSCRSATREVDRAVRPAHAFHRNRGIDDLPVLADEALVDRVSVALAGEHAVELGLKSRREDRRDA